MNAKESTTKYLEAIVLCDLANGIGRDGDQTYYISGDLERFKEKTMDHVMIAGRKTLATFPQGKGLKGRTNLILSRFVEEQDVDSERPTLYFDTLDSLLETCDAIRKDAPSKQFFILGGSSVYEQMMPYTTKVHLTRVNAFAKDVDRYFPDLEAHGFRLKSADEWLYDAENRVYYRYELWLTES